MAKSRPTLRLSLVVVLSVTFLSLPRVLAQTGGQRHDPAGADQTAAISTSGFDALNGQKPQAQTTPTPPPTIWQYGGFVDAAYLLDFNHPANDLFRSRGTTYKLDQPLINLAAAYLQKNASESSPWGMQLTVQAGQDTRVFGFSATAPDLPGSAGLRHLGPTNLSYRAPAGNGL